MARAKTEPSAAELAEPCANCGAALTGPYCAACGQKAHLHHRLWHLLEEMVEGVAHFDGRFWRSLPLLLLNPGKLSRDWKEGKRARYISPLHLFLFAAFLFFTLPSATGHHLIELPHAPTAVQASNARTVLREVQTDMRESGTNITIDESSSAGRQLGQIVNDRLKNNKYYSYKIEVLIYKLSFLLAPISMLILGLLLAFRRNTTFYDHGVVSLYGVGFGFLAITLYNAVVWTMQAFGWTFMVWVPITGLVLLQVHAVAHLKGAYQLSWLGAILRGLLLGWLSLTAFATFVGGLVAWGLMG